MKQQYTHKNIQCCRDWWFWECSPGKDYTIEDHFMRLLRPNLSCSSMHVHTEGIAIRWHAKNFRAVFSLHVILGKQVSDSPDV